MTLLTVDLSDLAGSHGPDDHVIIRADAFREATGGGITSTAEVRIDLVNGVGQKEVAPGPVVVTFHCEAVADTRPKRGVVPNSGTVSLFQVIKNDLTWTPEIVNDALAEIEGAIDDIVATVRFNHGPIPASVASLNDLPYGAHGVANITTANRLGLPGTLGTVVVAQIVSGKTLLYQTQKTATQDHALWISSISGGVVAPWEQVYPSGSDVFRGVLPTDVDSVADLDDGEWGVASSTIAQKLGLPGTLGTLKILPILSGKTLMYISQRSGNQGLSLWISSISGGVVAPWERVGGSGGAGGGGSPGLKTVGLALTAGSALNGTPGRFRVLTQFTAPITRWRLHVESRRLTFSGTTDFTLGAVSVGRHTGGGNLAGAVTLKTGNLAVAGSSEWVSRWIDYDLTDETLIDLVVSGNGLYSSQAPGWVLNGSTWTPTKNTPVSLWIEAETYHQTPVVGMIGDSTGAGQGANFPVHESALYVASRKHEFLPVAYTYPGSTMESMANPDLWIYQRWQHMASPDSVIIQGGSNDIHSGTALSALRTRFADAVEVAQSISPVVLGATVKARYPDSGTHAPVLTSYNAWVRTLPGGVRGFLDFYQVLSPGGTVSDGDAADGAHLTTAGHGKMALAFDQGVPVARPRIVDLNEFEAAGVALVEDATVQADRATAARVATESAQLTAFAGALAQGSAPPAELPVGAIFVDVTTGIFYKK